MRPSRLTLYMAMIVGAVLAIALVQLNILGGNIGSGDYHAVKDILGSFETLMSKHVNSEFSAGSSSKCLQQRRKRQRVQTYNGYSYSDFLANNESNSCCDTCNKPDGPPNLELFNDPKCGVPLDYTLKRLVYTYPGGFFIESGGQDGLFQSNTLIAERYFGWTGLLIEPAKSLQGACRINRPRSTCIHGALVQFGGPKGVADPGGSPMGKIAAGNETQAFPLSDILDARGITDIDLWSLDIEGHELNALKGVDWERHRPSFVMIEVWEGSRSSIFEHMNSVGYELVPGIHGRDDISGWAKPTKHRDYLWRDAKCKGEE